MDKVIEVLEQIKSPDSHAFHGRITVEIYCAIQQVIKDRKAILEAKVVGKKVECYATQYPDAKQRANDYRDGHNKCVDLHRPLIASKDLKIAELEEKLDEAKKLVSIEAEDCNCQVREKNEALDKIVELEEQNDKDKKFLNELIDTLQDENTGIQTKSAEQAKDLKVQGKLGHTIYLDGLKIIDRMGVEAGEQDKIIKEQAKTIVELKKACNKELIAEYMDLVKAQAERVKELEDIKNSLAELLKRPDALLQRQNMCLKDDFTRIYDERDLLQAEVAKTRKLLDRMKETCNDYRHNGRSDKWLAHNLIATILNEGGK